MSPPVCFHAFMLNWDGGTKASCHRYDGTKMETFMEQGTTGAEQEAGKALLVSMLTLQISTRIFLLKSKARKSSLGYGGLSGC